MVKSATSQRTAISATPFWRFDRDMRWPRRFRGLRVSGRAKRLGIGREARLPRGVMLRELTWQEAVQPRVVPAKVMAPPQPEALPQVMAPLQGESRQAAPPPDPMPSPQEALSRQAAPNPVAYE